MGWGRVKNGTDAGWKPEKPKPVGVWTHVCVNNMEYTLARYMVNCPFCYAKRDDAGG